MADKLDFPFVEKEGKFFAPIVSTEPKYEVQDGAVVQTGEKIVAGIKGVYAEVRIALPVESVDPVTQEVTRPSEKKSELYALNTEMFVSS